MTMTNALSKADIKTFAAHQVLFNGAGGVLGGAFTASAANGSLTGMGISSTLLAGYALLMALTTHDTYTQLSKAQLKPLAAGITAAFLSVAVLTHGPAEKTLFQNQKPVHHQNFTPNS